MKFISKKYLIFPLLVLLLNLGLFQTVFSSMTVTSGIGNFVWNDINKNGIQDSGEPGIEGVSVRVIHPVGYFYSLTTDSDGIYFVENLGTSNYTVEVDTPEGFVPSPTLVGDDRNIDSDVNGVSVALTRFALIFMNIDFGFMSLSSSITPTSGPNGSITPTEVTSVNQGEDQTFTITPNTGYQIEDVLVDGTSVGTLSTYTFTNVTTDHTISATFSQIPEKKKSTTSLKTRINNLNKMGKTDKVLELQKQYNVPTTKSTTNESNTKKDNTKPSTKTNNTSNNTNNTPNPISNNTRDLELNTTGDDVKSLQQFLNSKGYIINTPGQPGSTGYETTYFGNLTRQALIKFQQANNITPALGYYGPKTKAFVKTLLEQ